MKRILQLLSASILLLVACTPTGAGDLADRFKRVRDSVVVIGTQQHLFLAGSHGVERASGGNIGSGVLISDDGKVMTAAHLVQAASVIKVKFANGDVIDARVLASAPLADVALLQLDRVPTGAVVARLADASKVSIGDPVFVVGAPYGLEHTLTVGHVSGRHKPNVVTSGFVVGEVFQTDAAINQGNSGGPMFNMAGEVIGIVSHILSRPSDARSPGFATTSDTARRALLDEGAFWTGIEGRALAGALAVVFNLPQPVGVLVEHVADGSPAALLGLRPGFMPVQVGAQELLLGGDIILRVMGVPASQDEETYRRIQERLRRLGPGDTISVTVLRAGAVLELSAACPAGARAKGPLCAPASGAAAKAIGDVSRF